MTESTFMVVKMQLQMRADGKWRAALILDERQQFSSRWFATEAEAQAESDRILAGIREDLPKEAARRGEEIIFHEQDPRGPADA